MTYIDIIQTVAIVLGFGLTALTIQFLRKQTQEMTKATNAGVYQNVTVSMFQIDQLFIENPELRPYFYSNLEIPKNSKLQAKVYGMAEMLIDLLDNVRIQASNMPQYAWSTWKRYFEDIFKSSPTLREHLNTRKKWYPELLGWLKNSDTI